MAEKFTRQRVVGGMGPGGYEKRDGHVARPQVIEANLL
jgi:hypothetical protein